MHQERILTWWFHYRMLSGDLGRQKGTNGGALDGIPESDASISISCHDFSPLGRPRNCSNLFLPIQSSIQLGQFLSSRLIQVKNIDLSIFKTSSKKIVSVGIKEDTSDRAPFIIPESGQQLGSFSLNITISTWDTSKIRIYPIFVPINSLLLIWSLNIDIRGSLWGVLRIRARLVPWLILKFLSAETEKITLVRESKPSPVTLFWWILSQTISSYPVSVILIKSTTPSSSPTSIFWEARS